MLKSMAIGLVAAGALFTATTPAFADCDDAKAAGTFGGAVLGGIIGNQFGHGGGRVAATVGGAVLGGLAGREIARDSCRDDRYDAYYYNAAYDDAFDDGGDRRYEWRNPRTHHHGWVRPTEYYEDGWNDYDGPCRRFETRYYDRDDEAYAGGVACRTRNGTWKIVSMENDDD
ncbi:MAG: glycine zipper 2TM domain-containing protein [Alphaproteobacteria bacterium]|nr:glycine zipper 2TM domain-containing protein [Alphaproteobacteria bacterium]